MSDQYTITTRATAEHVKRMYKNGLTVKTLIEELTALMIVTPPDPVAPNILELRILERKFDEYVNKKRSSQ